MLSLGNNLFSKHNTGKSVYAGNLPLMNQGGLKSTQEKQQRIQKTASEINFVEKQKEYLKNTECDTVEEITKKLERFHDYEDQIAAAKKSYNNEQMYHVMDEAREMGEKIAEAAEELEPKTPEERAEEERKEALGVEEGALSEAMDDLQDAAEELLPEDMGELLDGVEQVTEQPVEHIENSENINISAAPEQTDEIMNARELELMKRYKPIDIKA